MIPTRVASNTTPTRIGALVAGVYLTLGAGSTVTARDAGELSAAAWRLDVAHPTGFALDMTLLRIAALAPVGDVALRMNVAVAVLGALSCALVARICDRVCSALPTGLRWICSLASVAVLLMSPTFVRAHTAVEVYAAALLLGLVALSLVDADTPTAPRRRLVAALAGMSLFTAHTSARPAVAISLVLLMLRGARGSGSGTLMRRFVSALTLAACTLPLTLWLPVASRRNGPLDWGDPETPRALFDHLSAASIRASFAGRMLVAWRIPEDTAHGALMIWQDLGPAALLVGLAGGIVAMRDPRARVFAAVGAIDFAYAVAVNPMGIVDRQTFFHLEACLVVLVGFAVASIAALCSEQRRPWIATVPLVLGCLAFVRRDPMWVARADGWSMPETLGGPGALGTVPPRGLVLCNSDDFCGGALYAQAVEGERPDVTVLPRQHLANAWTWRRVQPSRLGETIEDHSTGDARTIATARIHTLLARVGDRVRWEGTGEGEDTSVRARWRFVSGETPVLAAIAVQSMATTEVDRHADRWVHERLPPSMGSGARWVGAMVLFAAASRVARDDMMRASAMWQSTLSINPEHVSAYTNLGVAAARRGDLGAAITLTRAALAIDPERPVAWRNLRDFLRATGDTKGAREAERESIRRRW